MEEDAETGRGRRGEWLLSTGRKRHRDRDKVRPAAMVVIRYPQAGEVEYESRGKLVTEYLVEEGGVVVQRV